MGGDSIALKQYITKQITYTIVSFTDDKRNWKYYFKGVISPANVRKVFSNAREIHCEVKTEDRGILIEDFIKNSILKGEN